MLGQRALNRALLERQLRQALSMRCSPRRMIEFAAADVERREVRFKPAVD